MSMNKIIAMTGGRQSGKSGVLHALIESLTEKGIHIYPDGDTGRFVVVMTKENKDSVTETLKEHGFEPWGTPAFTPAHAMAYEGIPQRLKELQELEKEFALDSLEEMESSKPKKPANADLRAFLERKRRDRR